MTKRGFLALTIGTAALALSANFAAAGTLENIKARNKLIVAVLQDYPPYGSMGPDMQPVGIDIDVAKYMAKRLGVVLELVPTSGANRIPFMQTGKADIIIACLGKTAEREKVVTYSNPYIGEYNSVFGEEGNTVTKPEDLLGYKIAASRGGTEDLEVTNIAPSGTNIQRFEDTASALSAYTSGQVDMVATGTATANAFNKSSPRKLFVKIKMAAEPAYIGVPKGDEEMKDVANETIAAMVKDGTLAELAKTHIGDVSAADVAK
ncbi:transporter substrate-binding domain-containing protein [Aminobacter sp. Piv2-1]|uniref:transporter substrate-binding domain-containing protein n=1 Tax=Aminobacter sp. Piv2-1 TaxID=3031122 RepID=UPI0030957E48